MGVFDRIFGGRPSDDSSIDRVVGGTPREQKRLQKHAERSFREQDFGEMTRREVVKSPETIEMLELIDREIDLLREKYGLPPYRVPPENVHMMPPGDPAMRAPGEFSPDRQAMFVEWKPSQAGNMQMAFHEMVHFKSFQSIEVDDEDSAHMRRVGLSARVEDLEELGFGALNEAVTEELTKRFMKKMGDHPVVKPEVELKKSLFAKWGKPDDPELYRAREVRGQDGEVQYRLDGFGYPTERKSLNTLIDKIMERNPGKHADREEVFDMFASASFNGYLLELARTIESTFGAGTFRKLAEFGHKRDELLKFVESL